jgi:isopenicillin N synthase-like dioxygenase
MSTKIPLEDATIPLIDLRSWTEPTSATPSERADVARQIDWACRKVGFFVIKNHGINQTIIDRAWEASRDFFDLPLDTKLASKTNDEATYPYGYENSEQLVVGKRKDTVKDNEINQEPDPKETFSVGPSNPEAGMPIRRFPQSPKALQHSLEAYYEAMEQLSSTLLRIFAVALDLPPDYFDSFLTKHLSALRCLNYPAFDSVPANETTGSVMIRASEHTDYGALTILKSGGPGLQVKKDLESASHWIDAPVMNDAFIINIGDMMQRWTNDEWVSTLHRVVVLDKERRQSMAYFCNVNGDTIVSPLATTCRNHPPKYEPISAKEHLMAKHLASMGYGKEKG